MIERKQVKTFVTRLMCDTCKIEMRMIDVSAEKDQPVQYNYKCLKCGKKEIHNEGLPKTEYLEYEE